MTSNHLILCHPFLLSFPASGSFPMSWFFTSGGQSIRVSASLSVLPIFKTYFFMIDWLALLAVQGILKSLIQHCVDHNKLWKILKEIWVPDHLNCPLRNLYEGPEATVRTWHGTNDWFKIGKGVWQGCILSPYLFNFYAEYFMWNARMDESQARTKIARRNINDLIYVDTTLIGKSKEELKSLLMKVKENEKAGLKPNIQKTKIMASSLKEWHVLFSWASKITADGDCSHEIKRYLLLGRKAMTNLAY